MKESDTLLTIVVPAYNAEDYLENNIYSVCEPECIKGLEIIIIDDGSTDDTASVAYRLSEQYPDTVRVIRKENGGHGSGINTGLRSANGRYFRVVDSDDWLSYDALCKLMNFLKRCEDSALYCDMVINPYDRRMEDEKRSPHEFKKAGAPVRLPKGIKFDKVYDFCDVAERCDIIMMHNITYRTAVLKEHDIKIDEHCFYVDGEYIFFPIPFIKKIAFLPDHLYQYRYGRKGQSVDAEKMADNIKDLRRVFRAELSYYKTLPEDTPRQIKDYMKLLLARAYAGYVKVYLMQPDAYKRKKKFIIMDKKARTLPEVSDRNTRKTISLLRTTDYRLYDMAVWAVHLIFMRKR